MCVGDGSGAIVEPDHVVGANLTIALFCCPVWGSNTNQARPWLGQLGSSQDEPSMGAWAGLIRAKRSQDWKELKR